MTKKEKQIINFFKHNSVKLTVPFPISCFKKTIWDKLEPFSFDVLLKGQKRTIVFLGKNYNEFLTDNNIFKFFRCFRKIKSYKVYNGCISFTDIYQLNDIKELNHEFDCNKKSYSSIMYGYYKAFKKMINEYNKQYEYHAYLDVQSYYNSIYTHFLKGIQVKNINKFLDYEKKYNDDEWLKKNTKNWINRFFKAFEKHMCRYKQSHGIAMGNGISDFVAELYNKLIDFFVMSKNVNGLSLIRYRDDIFIFGNKSEQINDLYKKFQNILNKLQLHINVEKSYEATKGKINLNKKEYDYRDKLESNHKFTYLNKCSRFTNKFPKSNLIFHLLMKAYLDKHIHKYKIKSLINIFNKSRTNVLPLILSILDKICKNNKEKCVSFLEDILKKENKLSDSDMIWILCFIHKNQIEIQSSIGNDNFKQSWNKLKNYLNCNCKEINLFHDANKWSYGEIEKLE